MYNIAGINYLFKPEIPKKDYINDVFEILQYKILYLF